MTESRALPVAVGGVVVLLPFGDVDVPIVGMPLIYVAMAVPAGLAVHRLVLDRATLPESLILLGSGLGVMAGMVSAAGGVAPDRSIPLVVVSVITLGCAIGITLAYRPGLEVPALDLLVVVGGVVAVMALTSSAGALQAVEAGNVVSGRLTGPFSQPNELGTFCAALLPIAVACVVTTASWRRAVVLGLAAALLATACAMSMSRGAWIAAVVALLGLAVCEPVTRRAIAAVGLALGATCMAALAVPASMPVLGVLGARIRSLRDPTQNQYDERPLTWAEALRLAGEHPWLGVGPGGFQDATSSSASALSANPPDHPHNLVLTALADRGVIGAALAVVVVVGCIVAARRQLLLAPRLDAAARTARTRSVAVLAGLAAIAVHGTFDMPLRNPIVSGLVWTLLGMAVVAETARTSAPWVIPGPTERRPVPTNRK